MATPSIIKKGEALVAKVDMYGLVTGQRYTASTDSDYFGSCKVTSDDEVSLFIPDAVKLFDKEA